ncbi:MAG: hypothetical protein K8I30_13395 [Anaerolineae bacterium]|nr:hypothetical protein [Anaerolineae bacterium]
MAHEISWDNPDKTVVLQVYTETPSKDDLYQLAEESAAMLSTVSQIVHLILDERRINLILTAADMTFLQKQTPRNQGTVVMLVDPSRIPYKTAIHNLAQRLNLSTFAQPYFADSVEEARYILQQTFGVRYPSDALK